MDFSVLIQDPAALRQRLDRITESFQRLGRSRAVVGTDVPYARFVHEGTRPHTISARGGGFLSWKGARHPVRSVRHPGYRGNPFLRQALENKTPRVLERVSTGIREVLEGGPIDRPEVGLQAGALEVQAEAVRLANARTGTLRRSLHTRMETR